MHNSCSFFSGIIILIPFNRTKLIVNVASLVLQLDILMNNSGRSKIAAFEDIDIAVDRETFEINTVGPVNLTRVALKYFFENGIKSHIVVTSSTIGKLGALFSATYTGSKHALHVIKVLAH